MECNHRKLFLMKKRKLVIKKCILGNINQDKLNKL